MSAQPGATAEVQGLCNYYARAGYYRHIQTVCNEFLRKKSNSDPALVFWRAYGAMREGSINEAIRDLDSIRREGELLFAVLVALLHAHNLSKIVDTDEVARIGAALDRERARVGERGLLMAAQFAWHAERLEDAREYVERLLALKPGSTQGNILRCWIELSAGALPAHELWDAHGGKKELEALMGKARHAETLGQHAKALDNLNQVIVHYAWFLPALAEKAKLLMAMANWPQARRAAPSAAPRHLPRRATCCDRSATARHMRVSRSPPASHSGTHPHRIASHRGTPRAGCARRVLRAERRRPRRRSACSRSTRTTSTGCASPLFSSSRRSSAHTRARARTRPLAARRARAAACRRLRARCARALPTGHLSPPLAPVRAGCCAVVRSHGRRAVFVVARAHSSAALAPVRLFARARARARRSRPCPAPCHPTPACVPPPPLPPCPKRPETA